MSEARHDRSTAPLVRAIRLSWLSVCWAVLSGTASITIGILDHSVAVVGVGVNLVGDLLGSLVLIWRFVQTRRGNHRAPGAERLAGLVVATSLALVAIFLVVQSIRHLADGIGPSSQASAVAVAAASVVVLPPLAIAKRRVGDVVGSRALRGDGTLSGVGAAIAALALGGLVVARTLGWWWADSAAGLTVAVIAGVEARLLLGAVLPRPRSKILVPDTQSPVTEGYRMTQDLEGYGARPAQSDIGRLLEDCRTLSGSGIERIAGSWRQHEASPSGHDAWHDAEHAALQVLEATDRARAWDEVRNQILDLTEHHDALVSWRAEHGETGHRAEDALLGAALALSARPELDHRHEQTLLGPMSAALPWLAALS